MLLAIHHGWFPGVALVCLLLAPSADASVDVSTSINHTDNDAPTFLPKKSGLRVPNTLADRERFLDIATANQMQTPFGELSKQEQVELLKSLKSSMTTLLDEIKVLDLSDVPQDLKHFTEIGTTHTENAIEVVVNALPFLESQILGTHSFASGDVPEHDDLAGPNGGCKQRRLEGDFAGRSNDAGDSPPNENFGGNHKSQWQKSANGQQKPGPHHYEYMGHSFYPHANSHHARKMSELKEMVTNGDLHSIFSSFGARNSQPSSGSRHDRQRRMRENTKRRLTINEQCDLLADCASHMSLYDTFVYYYSDDIDPATGKIDNNLIKFDERNISKKYQLIQAAAKAIIDGGSNRHKCDSLLKLFHRTIEHGSVPEWEGASINQVCLAEGTTVFVKFQEMAFALVDQSFPDGYSQGSEEEWKNGVDKAMQTVAKQVAVEPFQCAEEMFYKAFRVESFRRGVKCDKSSEITTEEECIDWGRKSGANMTLHGGKPLPLNVSRWNGAPCGCSIENKNGALRFNLNSTDCQNRDWQYTLVCKRQTACDAGNEISSIEECRQAGLSLPGTSLGQNNVVIQEDVNSPAGCVINQRNGAIHFDDGKGKTGSESHYFSSPVCKIREVRDPKQFPFGGCGGKSDKCAIEKYKFPLDIDIATEATKEKKYETIRNRIKCDRGYEITSPDECEKAGLKVGGLTKNNKINNQDRGDIPCGCSIYPGDRWIHWNRRSTCENHGWRHVVVCKEHRNRDDFELVEFESHCPQGQEPGSVEDCAEAGQALGGILEHAKVIEAVDRDIPCGCSIYVPNGHIHFNVERTKKCKAHNDFQKVCKNSGRPFVTSRRRVRCDKGYGVTSLHDCKKAGSTLTTNPHIKDGHWGHTPCNCFIWKDTNQLHFDTDQDCSKGRNDGQSMTVCKNHRNGEKYKRVQFATKCVSGEEVSQQECEEAGQALFGWLEHGQLAVGKWGHVPCGCSVYANGKIHFNTETQNCRNQGYVFDAVCHQSSTRRRLASDDTGSRHLGSFHYWRTQPGGSEQYLKDEARRHSAPNIEKSEPNAEKSDALRDDHGKLNSNGMAGFLSADYDSLMRKAESCVKDAMHGVDKECLESHGNEQNSKYYECRVKKRKTAIEECDRFGPIQRALGLVFGPGTSPGFICGVRDAVVEGVAMPGSCCLDAPYERDGKEWGQPYDCASASCKHPGPFLSGINDVACKAHGGTWCPSKSGCDTLQRCMTKLVTDAKSDKHVAFEHYVKGAPELNNTNDREQCGRVRAYFGFDENFINDKQICEDVEQLKFAKDFDFLDEFFKQGSDQDIPPGESPELSLTPPDRSYSNHPAVKNHWTWKKTNFGLEMSVAAMDDTVEFIDAMPCMCDITCISEWACENIKSAIWSAFKIIARAVEKIWMISVEMWDIESAGPSVVSAQENSEVIFENMQKIANYLVEMRGEIPIRRELLPSLPGGQSDIKNSGVSLRNFRVKLGILEKTAQSKSFYAHSTLNGVLADAKFMFSRVDADRDTEVPVPFNRTNLAPGKSIFRFGSDIENVTFLVMEASPIEGEEVFNEMVFFDD